MIVRHAWTGDPHASASTRTVDGVEVARNQLTDPSFELGPPTPYGNDDATELTTDHALHGDHSVRSYDKNGGATRLGVKWQVEGPPGYYASSIWAYIPSTNAATIDRANFQWSSRSVNWRAINPVFDRWFKIDDVVLIESGQSGSFWVGLETTGSKAGDHVYLDAPHVAFGNTEAEAAAQVAEYFDGGATDYQHTTARLFQFGEWITLP